MEQLGYHGMDFHEIWYLSIFQKPVAKIKVSLKSDINTNVHLWSYLAQFFLEWEMFLRKVVEKIEMHFIANNFFPKIFLFLS